MILHSLEPWLIARHEPNRERTAAVSLAQAGFECWFPTYLEVRPLPLRKVPPRKRHLAAYFLREIRCARFPGYLFVRPLPFCRYDLNRLVELRGCGGVVTLGGKAAKIQDFDVELMRLAEAQGKFDVHIGVGRRRYFIERENCSMASIRSRSAISKKFPNVDESREFRLLVDALGRIARIIGQAEGDETGLSAQGVVSR